MRHLILFSGGVSSWAAARRVADLRGVQDNEERSWRFYIIGEHFMHVGKLDNDTAAARVYETLRDLDGEWIGGWELSQAARTTAVSTRVSEVRAQLPADEVIDVDQVDRRFYYRLRRVGSGEQMEMLA